MVLLSAQNRGRFGSEGAPWRLRPSNRAGGLAASPAPRPPRGPSGHSTGLPARRPPRGPRSAVCAQWKLGFTLARLYGDESELHFWTVAAHYLHSLSQERAASTTAARAPAPRDRVNNPLDICYDILCENAYFQVLSSYIKTVTALSLHVS